ncbi:folate-binding protein YgfZ [Pandoraea terrae]
MSSLPAATPATPAEQFAALQTGSFASVLADAGLITVSGADAADFLHNQLTSDIERLPADMARLAGYCSAKGRLLATFLAWRNPVQDDTQISLVCAADVQSAVQKRLSMFVLRARAKLTDGTAERMLIAVGGPAATHVLAQHFAALPTVPLAVVHDAGGSLVRLPDAGDARTLPRYLWSVPADAAAAAWQALLAAPGLVAVQPELAHWLDVRSGVPSIVAATQEQFVPQMINWEVLGGVNFRKGCYPGQEVVARSQYRGVIKRRLFLAHLDGGQPAPGRELFEAADPGQPCGLIVNTAPAPQGGWDCLVELKLTAHEADAVHLGTAEGPRLQFAELPYVLFDPTETTS